MTLNDTSTRATIVRDGDDTYFLYVRTLQNSSEDIFVTANLTGEDVETIAGWAHAPKAAPGTYPHAPAVRVGLIELSLYANNVITVRTGYQDAIFSWQLTETSSRKLIEEAERWTR